MADDKLCIICNSRKPAAGFETKGEHIVPRFLGNRKLRTPHVCKACNGGLGGTVDIALKNVGGVTRARLDRGVGGTIVRTCGIVDAKDLTRGGGDDPRGNPDVKGAMLKIVYETAHLRLGNCWLDEPEAAAMRNVLFAYVNKDRAAAHRLMSRIDVNHLETDVFYHAIGKSRGELLKRAIGAKTCLNGLWLIPMKTGADTNRLTIVFDIEGLPAGYAAVSGSIRGIDCPELIAPASRHTYSVYYY